MKNTLLIIVTVFMAFTSSSQKWQQTIGQPNHNETSRRVIEHYDKGYIISAQFGEFGWLVKTDINGNVLWDKVMGNYPAQVITGKTLYDGMGNIYMFGTIVQEVEGNWPLVIKLNACGEKQWCRLLNITGYEYGTFYDAILLDNGDLLGLANMPDEEQYDMVYLFRISPDGEYIWRKSFASVENHPLFEMRLGTRIQKFGDIYVISGYVYSPHPDYPTISSIRPMFIGIDTLFNEQWVLEFGMIDNMKGKALTSIPINDSLFMGVGRYRYVGATGQTMDAWAMFYNDDGEQVGQQVLTTDQFGPGVNESTFYEIERVNDSVFMATIGYIYGEEDETPMGEVVFDTAGNVYNYSIRDEIYGSQNLVKTFDGKYAIATSTLYDNLTWDIVFYKINENLEHDTIYPGIYNYDSLCPDLPIQSGVIDLTGCDVITSLDEIPSLEDYNKLKNTIEITAYPNPVTEGEVRFEYKNLGFSEPILPPCPQGGMFLTIFNTVGDKVHEAGVYSYQEESTVNVQNWGKGMYFAVVYSNGKPIGKCKFVVH